MSTEGIAKITQMKSVGVVDPAHRIIASDKLIPGFVLGRFYPLRHNPEGLPNARTARVNAVVVRGNFFTIGYVDLELRLGDRILTGPNCILAIEFATGGRVGVNKDSDVEIIRDRQVADTKPGFGKMMLRKAHLWGKIDRNKTDPIEIQTNGGVMGIKG